MLKQTLWLLAMLMMGSAWTHRLDAQSSTAWSTMCAEAAAALDPSARAASGVVRSKDWALEISSSHCPNGAQALAAAWAIPQPSTLYPLLAARSARISDKRILHAALAVATNPSQPELARRAALDLIVREYAPALSLSDQYWSAPDSTSLTVGTDILTSAGEQPLSAHEREAVLSALTALGSDPSVPIRKVANALRTTLPRWRAPIK
jgi:hypothetical protein